MPEGVTARPLEAATRVTPSARPHVVIVGAGFGGLACAQALGSTAVDVTVVDRRNHHLFVPLLYQVATAALSPADIAEPIRRLLSRHDNVRVVLAEVSGIDPAGRSVRLAGGGSLTYDCLVLATGSSYSYFGHDEWAALAPGVKSIEDARRLRARLLDCFERAEIEADPVRREALITTVVVGGGPTGVEMAGAIAELARHALARDFRNIDPRCARVILVEAGPRLLSAFPPALSDYARRQLQHLGVTVLTGQSVQAVRPDGVLIDGRLVAAGTLVWGAGVQASPAGRWLGMQTDRTGRIPVAPDLSVPGFPAVHAIGDTAAAPGAAGRPLPGLAQVAKQQGQHLGDALARALGDGRPVPAFTFKNRGNTAVIGRNAAVFDFGSWTLTGWLAWVLWAIVHVYLLVGFDKRVRVCIQWLWRYATYQRGARLITAEPGLGPAPGDARPARLLNCSIPLEVTMSAATGALSIRDLMTRGPQTVGPTDTIQRAAQLMDDLNVGALPVCEGERLLGMVTDRDITVRATAAGRNPGQTPITEVMSTDVRWCTEDSSLEEAAGIMQEVQIRRLPVVDSAGRLAGVVSLGDMATSRS